MPFDNSLIDYFPPCSEKTRLYEMRKKWQVKVRNTRLYEMRKKWQVKVRNTLCITRKSSHSLTNHTMDTRYSFLINNEVDCFTATDFQEENKEKKSEKKKIKRLKKRLEEQTPHMYSCLFRGLTLHNSVRRLGEVSFRISKHLDDHWVSTVLPW